MAYAQDLFCDTCGLLPVDAGAPPDTKAGDACPCCMTATGHFWRDGEPPNGRFARATRVAFPAQAPTVGGLDAAWQRLCDANPRAICDLSLGSIGEVAFGNPPHAPDRYSPSEVRLARALIIVAAMALKAPEVA